MRKEIGLASRPSQCRIVGRRIGTKTTPWTNSGVRAGSLRPELGADGDDWKEEMEEEWPDEGQDAGHWEDAWNGGEQVPVCSANGG